MKIIRPLIDNNICSNFILPIAKGVKCTYTDLTNIISKSRLRLEQSLPRNIAYIYKGLGNRPSIQNRSSSGEEYKIFEPTAQTLKYDIIITKAIDENTVKLGDFFKKNPSVEDICKIFFQLAYTYYVLYLSRTTHNDGHWGNVFIKTLNKEEPVWYVINCREYSFYTKHKVLIYDFDLSYCERLGKNPKIEGDSKAFCITGGCCNRITKNRDMIKSMYYLNYYLTTYININSKTKEVIKDTLYRCLIKYNDTNKTNLLQNLKKLYASQNGGWTLLEVVFPPDPVIKQVQLDELYYEHFASLDEIADNIYNYCKISKVADNILDKSVDNLKQTNLFICDINRINNALA